MLTISHTLRNIPSHDGIFLSSGHKKFYQECLKKVLGEDYELSLVFVGNKLSRRLNRTHRGMDKPTDILSFPLEKNVGEIFINIPYCHKKRKEFDRTFENYIKFIFIHGLFHLKGYEHSSRMENEERKVRTAFNV